jgi:hypothetical protein
MRAGVRACIIASESPVSLCTHTRNFSSHNRRIRGHRASSSSFIIIIIRRARVVADASVFETSRARHAYLVNVTARGARDVERRRRRCDSNEGGKKKEDARAHFGFDLDLIRFDSNARDDGGSETLVDGRCERV